MRHTTVSRRNFIQLGAAMGGALGLGLTDLGRLRAQSAPGLGPLVSTASENTGEVLLALPEGFKYNVLIRNGSMMSDGRPFPSNADGMGAFPIKDLTTQARSVRLVCNHERGAGTPIGSLPYDPMAGGGTTTHTFDPHTRLLTESFVSSSGHVRNCAGGITPWGTWLTCEETNAGPSATLGKQHGYIFEIPASASVESVTEPLVNMGLHYPEAAVIDPRTSVVYITSDRNPCGLFRFVPEKYGRLAGRGRVQMLAIQGMPGYDTRVGQVAGTPLPVAWVDIDDPSNEAEYRTSALYTYNQGLAKGGATFTRGEGAWYSNGTVYFACSNGGNAGLGQIFALHLMPNDTQALELVYESASSVSLAAPDNICVSPSGRNIIICEDGSGAEYLHVLRSTGEAIFPLAENRYPGFEGSEWAGACFCPLSKTLFANLQGASVMYAIWADPRRWAAIY